MNRELLFWEKVEKTEGCWEWRGCRQKKGYGQFSIGSNLHVQAHRYSYQISVGPIPDGLFVCHHRDNKGCVRPDHLFLGTNRENILDASAKGLLSNQNKDKTHCVRGHHLSGENLWVRKDGGRACRICRRLLAAGERQRKRDRLQLTIDYAMRESEGVKP